TSLPRVGAGLGDRGDDCACRLLILGLEIVRDDAELLDRVPREGIPAARVLSRHAAGDDVVLVACAINEDIDLLGRLRAGGERLSRAVEPVGRDARTR